MDFSHDSGRLPGHITNATKSIDITFQREYPAAQGYGDQADGLPPTSRDYTVAARATHITLGSIWADKSFLRRRNNLGIPD